MNKHAILAATTFGQRIAEDEADSLASYFVETDQWRRVISGAVNVIYGPKGSGKSALYSLLRNRRDELLQRDIVPAAGEAVRGTPVFEALVAEPPTSENQFRGLWKLYFLSLSGSALRILKADTEEAQKLTTVLERAGLLPGEWSLKRSLRGVIDYLNRIDSVSGELKIGEHSGVVSGVEGKITLREPTETQINRGYVSADGLLEIADKAFKKADKQFWIVLDRLDVAFTESEGLEENALRALFRVYRDMAALENVCLKIFLRDDIWRRITSDGFREASHITKAITITWNDQALLNLVIRRALHNPAICEYYGTEVSSVLSSAKEQQKLFYRIFPAQVDPGERKSTTLDWMLTRTADGSGTTAPRELIHLLSAARDQQLRLLEMGAPEPPGEVLIDRAAIKAALPEVSKARFEQTLCAEEPKLKPMLDKLEGEKTQQTAAALAKIWRLKEGEALSIAEKLVEVGFFQKRGSKEQPLFWVPFLYRDALKLVQGQAEE